MEIINDSDMEDDYATTARPIQIVSTEDDHTFVLDEDTLTEVLLQDDIKDRFVVVVSVAGAFRKGKSFLLDFFLRYLYARVSLKLPLNLEFWLIAINNCCSIFSIKRKM